jgi:hypothetical protein
MASSPPACITTTTAPTIATTSSVASCRLATAMCTLLGAALRCTVGSYCSQVLLRTVPVCTLEALSPDPHLQHVSHTVHHLFHAFFVVFRVCMVCYASVEFTPSTTFLFLLQRIACGFTR